MTDDELIDLADGILTESRALHSHREWDWAKKRGQFRRAYLERKEQPHD